MTRIFREDRRAFLRRTQALLAGGLAYAMLPQLQLVGQAMAAEPLPGNDYKALVCIFLFGGSDSFNMLIPHDAAEYQAYSISRGGTYDPASNPTGLAYARDALATMVDADGKTWGLNPACAAMTPLFERGELAFLANVGPLVEPVSKTDVLNALRPLPINLYSHNDQQRQWMRGHADNPSAQGWGGLLSDYVEAANTGLQVLSPSISIAGNNLFQTGRNTLPFVLSSGGPPVLSHFRDDGGNADRIRHEALRAVVDAAYAPVMEDSYALLGQSALTLNGELGTVLDPAHGGDIATVFPDGGLAAQLRMVARMIKASRGPAIGHRRQVYFVSLGGFDTHQNQMDANGHGALLGQLAGSLVAFREALAEIGALDSTMTFSMSDFGRTLNSNGNGSDHGWGGVQLVMGNAAANGGALHGRRVWGGYPLLELDGEQATGRGRMVPTTSVNQMGATLAQWFGVSASGLDAIFPGLGNFDQRTIGFLA